MEVSIDLTGVVAIVTGGTRGIGRSIADRMVALGGQVVICGRRPPAASSTQEGLHFVAADVRDPDQAQQVIDATVERFGRLDVLVNNAGGSPPAEAATASPRFSSAIVGLNLLAPLSFAQKANAIMQAQPGGGCIVNIASVSGTRPSPGTAAYGAAKAGLLNLTRTLAVEWAPRVRVNALVVGLVRTEAAASHYGDEAAIARVAQTIPMGRLARPGEIADAVLLLCSPLASYISGAALEVHGGGERPAFLSAVSS